MYERHNNHVLEGCSEGGLDISPYIQCMTTVRYLGGINGAGNRLRGIVYSIMIQSAQRTSGNNEEVQHSELDQERLDNRTIKSHLPS